MLITEDRAALEPQGFFIPFLFFFVITAILFIFFEYWGILILLLFTSSLIIYWEYKFQKSFKKTKYEFLGLNDYSWLLVGRSFWNKKSKLHKKYLPKLHPNIKILVSSFGLNPNDINDFSLCFDKEIYKIACFKYLTDDYTLKKFQEKIIDKGVYSIPHHFLNHPNVLNHVIGLENFAPNKPISNLELSKIKEVFDNESIMITFLSSRHCKVYLNQKLKSQVDSLEKAIILKYINIISKYENLYLIDIQGNLN